MRGEHDLGDGDLCPLVPSHGKMSALMGTSKQYCRHQSHDGRPKSHPLGPTDPTRSFWPLADNAFAKAVAEYKEEAHG